ncbi:MAG: Fibronectin type domain protein [Myxococcales bacterium]|nr:Fibronectin type domain protein [Myxococcales bacterium]
MSVISRRALLAPVFLMSAARARADSQQCVDVQVDFTPSDSLQIVAWVEDATGKYLDTIYLTRKVGVFGLGNRPGRFDFNSGPVPNPAAHVDDMWPYGRRVTTFPVWAHRHGLSFPKVVFQNGDENGLSHSSSESSSEHDPYCRPLLKDADPSQCGCMDKMMWDTGTCATPAFSDKGKLSATEKSLYPPRVDVTRQAGVDSPSVDMYKTLNPFDAVSHATPIGGQSPAIRWAAPMVGAGQYSVFVEVSKEFDMNAVYNPTMFPSPTVSYGDYGLPYRGQPSVVYSVPFTVSGSPVVATSQDYIGYSDPTGNTGDIRPPDTSITTTTPGSGASRLELVSDGSAMYRLRVTATPVLDNLPPDAPTQLDTTAVGGAGASLRFIAPGDDGQIGKVAGYEIRVRANSEITADNFTDSMPVTATIAPADPGMIQTFDLGGLLPSTDYWVAVRAFDKCHNPSPLVIAKFTTTDRQIGEVNACFIATAAYGSAMANEVELLRHFRDEMLRSSVLGELAIETYYTFGPAVAGVVGESELMRATARQALAPVIAWVREWSP